MKTHRLLLPMLMGALAVLAALAALSRSQAVAEVPHEWIGRWYWKDGGWTDYAPSGVPDLIRSRIVGAPAVAFPLGLLQASGPTVAPWQPLTRCGGSIASSSVLLSRHPS